jgi:diadenosine tetraphosphate (Ap4A) HIT family hydrolase
MVTKCEYCEIMERGENIIASSDDVIAVVRDKVVTPGQITVFPKEHLTIMEMVPDEVIQKCAIIANKISVAIFESLEAHGTNIIIRNGLGAGQDVPHFGIEIIPRKENDGINLQWEPRQLMEDDIEMIHSTIIDALQSNQGKKTGLMKKEDIKEDIKEVDGKENYLLKSIRRTP